ncbi:MAG: CinA family nicotinamide mononucleotide deamidase-related protein [bacterium]|nr:CinA family nicotinamide mononucleotide deamidase-related protein [bacterium]
MAKTSEVEIILVGNELLKGERRDSHAQFIGNLIGTIGVRLTRAHIVPDDREIIGDTVRRRMRSARAIVVSGGLGPTHDDITREAVADGLGASLEFREDQWKWIVGVFSRFNKTPHESNKRQAYFPPGSEVIPNALGTAPGFMIEKDGCLVAVLPGPPRELRPMMESTVLDKLQSIFRRDPLFTETFRTTGIGESDMTPKVGPLFANFEKEFVVSSLPHLGGVDVVLTARTDGDLKKLKKRADKFEASLREILGAHVFGKGTRSFQAVVGDLLIKRGETLGVSESLTGGLIGKNLTDTPGSSAYLLADVVAYSNESKVEFVGVRKASLKKHGAVSEVVCREMAAGIRARTDATYGLATTGIAGPDGGTKEKPVGLTYFGLASGDGEEIRHRVFPGDRITIRERVAYATLYLLYRKLTRV